MRVIAILNPRADNGKAGRMAITRCRFWILDFRFWIGLIQHRIRTTKKLRLSQPARLLRLRVNHEDNNPKSKI